jgi:hypothetical protein
VKTYEVCAKRWKHGWELHIDGVGVTQSKGLKDAEMMARDLVSRRTGNAEDSFGVCIVPDLGGLEKDAAAVREHNTRIRQETRDAAAASRKLARQLRAAGLSGADTAAVLGVSKGRVSQLVHH